MSLGSSGLSGVITPPAASVEKDMLLSELFIVIADKDTFAKLPFQANAAGLVEGEKDFTFLIPGKGHPSELISP